MCFPFHIFVSTSDSIDRAFCSPCPIKDVCTYLGFGVQQFMLGLKLINLCEYLFWFQPIATN